MADDRNSSNQFGLRERDLGAVPCNTEPRIAAQRTRTVGATSTGARKVYACRSGMITSCPGFRFKYGFVQVVANIPHAKGLWPAVWYFLANLAEYLPGKRGYCSGQFRDQVGRDLEVLINQVLQVLIRPGSSHLGRKRASRVTPRHPAPRAAACGVLLRCASECSLQA